MTKTKLRNSAEGLTVTLLGLVFLGLALGIRKNPVAMEIAWVNLFAQAKFFPTICACAVLLLGVLLTVSQWRGNRPSAVITPREGKRLAVIVPLIAAYLLAVYFTSFAVPTILYTVAILFYLNLGKKKWWKLAIICGVYVCVALLLLPKIIGLRLP